MARERARKPGGCDVAVVVGDMTTCQAPGTFSLVYVVYNAITSKSRASATPRGTWSQAAVS